MARPVGVAAASAVGLAARDGIECAIGEGAEGTAGRVLELLADPARRARMGEAARTCVEARYSWQAHLALLDQLLSETA